MAKRRFCWGKLLLGVVLGTLLFFLLVQVGFAIQVAYYSVFNPRITPVMQESLVQLRRERPDAQLQYQWVPYDQISDNLKRAVVAAEDSRFTQHFGVDWEAVQSAWEHNRELARRRAEAAAAGQALPAGVMRGASTITQQTAKNLFLTNQRSYWRKGQELLIAWMMELIMSKERILELYLNVAEWGHGVFGAQAAARHHFQTDASQLSTRQAAQLAARLPNPRFYDERGVTRYLNARTNTLQARQRHAVIP